MAIEDLRVIGNVLYERRSDGLLYPVRQVAGQVPAKSEPQASQGLLSGIPELGRMVDKLGLLNRTFNPIEGIGQSMDASRRMVAPDTSTMDRLAALGDMLSGVAGVTAPIGAAVRAGLPAAVALMEGLLGGSPTVTAARDTARAAGRGFVERMNQPGPVPTMGSNFANLLGDVGTPNANSFAEMAQAGSLRQARTLKQDISDITAKKMPANIIDLKGADEKLQLSYETGALANKLRKAGLFIEDNMMGKIYVGTTPENLDLIKGAKTPAEFGKAYGYSDADIAQFYLKRRGGDVDTASQEYLKDAGFSSPIPAQQGLLSMGSNFANLLGKSVIGGMKQKVDKVSDMVRSAYGVTPQVSYHPTKFGNSAYLTAKILGPGNTYANVGFRLSDHDIGDFRRQHDEVQTIIDKDEITPEELFSRVDAQYTSSIPAMQKLQMESASRKALSENSLQMWGGLSSIQKGNIAKAYGNYYLRSGKFNKPWKSMSQQDKAEYASLIGQQPPPQGLLSMGSK